MKRESQAPRSGSLTARNGRSPERVLGRRPTARMEFKPAWRNGVVRGRAERFRRTSRLPQSASEAFPIAKAAQAAGQRGPRELLRAASEGGRVKRSEPPARSRGAPRRSPRDEPPRGAAEGPSARPTVAVRGERTDRTDGGHSPLRGVRGQWVDEAARLLCRKPAGHETKIRA